FLNNTLGQADGVFEVEAIPRHECGPQVLTQGQFAHVGGRTIRHDVAARNRITLADQRTLVDAGVLVGTGVLGEVVDIHTGFTGFNFIIMHAHNDPAGIDRVDDAATTGHDADTGVTGDVALHASTYQGLVGTQGRHSLTLHVRTHECTVGVIVLQEWNQRSSYGHHLTRRHVHQGHVFGSLDAELVEVTDRYQFVSQHVLLVPGRRSLGDHVISLFNGGQEHDLVGNLAFLDHPVWAFQEAVLVSTRVGCQGVDQTDVRTFRRFDRTHTAVVSR